MRAILAKELRQLFHSPLAWGVLAALQLILAWLFMLQLEQFLQIQQRLTTLQSTLGVTALVIAPLIDSAATVALLMTPLLTMNSFSREYQQGTIDLLLAAPISSAAIVGGKFLALLLVLVCAWLLVAAMPLSLLVGTWPDIGTLIASLLALALALAGYAAIGLWASSLTTQPAIAAVISYAVLLLLSTLNLTAGAAPDSPLLVLSLSFHLQRMLGGLVGSGDLIYFALLVATPLLLTVMRLRRLRGGG
ncbi:MAG: ABC transporter permease subunit [Gammaproteobacteria bacterium]|nr:ABC transporter permease subunit [Gammaproteobacteria bacterium]